MGACSQPEVVAVEEEERRLGLEEEEATGRAVTWVGGLDDEEEGLEGALREESFLFFSERGWEVY